MIYKFIYLFIFMGIYSCTHKNAQLVLSSDNYDFGIVKKDSLYRGAVSIKNKGNDTLKIINIVVGCGCTKASVTKQIVLPEDTCWLNFIYNTYEKKGKQEEFICLHANTDSLVYVVQLKAFIE